MDILNYASASSSEIQSPLAGRPASMRPGHFYLISVYVAICPLPSLKTVPCNRFATPFNHTITV